MERIGFYVMGGLYILAGLNHFRAPGFYLPMMPPYIPQHQLMITLSGLAEIFLGAFFLWPKTTQMAAWGIIAMLIVFFSVHIYMLQERDTVFAQIPNWILIARIPLQFVLIAWAYIYTK